MARPDERQPLLAESGQVGGEKVYQLIHAVNRAIRLDVDTALTWDQLNSPEINYSIIRPLVHRWSKDRSDAIIYALLVNRVQFQRLADQDLAYAALQTARAAICEVLAIKVLRSFAESELQLVSVLTRGYSPFQGAPEDVWKGIKGDKEDLEEDIGNALEMAIVSSAKHFLATPLTQKVVSLIRSGQVVYNSASRRSLITDNYTSERRAQAGSSGFVERSIDGLTSDPAGTRQVAKQPDGVYLYDPRLNGWLDYTRLRIPKWRAYIEFFNFAILLALFIWNLAAEDLRVSLSEVLFVFFTLGFALDEFAASKEHGWTIYLASAWNAFDVTFILVFFAYLVMRAIGLATHNDDLSQLSFDVLSMGACILFPRIAFFFIRDNVIIISLKAMIGDFVGFMSLAVVCFSGLLFTLWTLGRETWSVRQIAWLMLQIWFGSSYLGFSASTSFHPIFGPILLVIYAALSNTLLVTILISILSNRFAAISSNAKEEHLFQKAIDTIEGVKADAIFSYLPPINILAFCILWPLGFVLSPQSLHRVNVLLIRLTAFPILILISFYERWRWQTRDKTSSSIGSIPSRIEESMLVARPGLFESVLGPSSASAIEAVFDHEGEETVIQVSKDGSDDDATHLSPGTSGVKSNDQPGDINKQRTKLPQTPKKAATTAGQTAKSPLSKLWGKGTSSPTEGKAQPSSEEVEDLKMQLREMREGMARMEALLLKSMKQE